MLFTQAEIPAQTRPLRLHHLITAGQRCSDVCAEKGQVHAKSKVACASVTVCSLKVTEFKKKGGSGKIRKGNKKMLG